MERGGATDGPGGHLWVTMCTTDMLFLTIASIGGMLGRNLHAFGQAAGAGAYMDIYGCILDMVEGFLVGPRLRCCIYCLIGFLHRVLWAKGGLAGFVDRGCLPKQRESQFSEIGFDGGTNTDVLMSWPWTPNLNSF